MKKLTQQGAHAIAYASAHVNATLAIAEAAIEVLFEGQEAENEDLAQAVKLILDDQAGPLDHWMERLEQAVAEHHPDPGRIEQPRTHASYAARAEEATEKYDRHMEEKFPAVYQGDQEITQEAVFHTLVTTPVAINRAIRRLAAETASRQPGSPDRTAYIKALLEVAAKVPRQTETLTKRREMDPPDSDRKRHLMNRAQAAALDTETIEAIHRANAAGENQEEQDDPPWVQLAFIEVTLQGTRVITSIGDAQALALAWGTTLTIPTPHPAIQALRADLDHPQTTIEVQEPGDGTRPTSTITITVENQEKSPREELTQAADLLALTISRTPATETPPEGTVLRTRMCISTDRIPLNHPETRHREPVTENFLTPSGHRCLNAITWRRDDEIEQAILQDHGDIVNSYLFWSESLTTTGQQPTSEELLEILMATFTVGAKFLLQDNLDSQ